MEGYIQTTNGVQLEVEKIDNNVDVDIDYLVKSLKNKGMSLSKILETVNTTNTDNITMYKIKKILKDS